MSDASVKFEDLLDAFEFVSFSGYSEHEAFLCRRTGKIYRHSENDEDEDPLPQDFETPGRYLSIPKKNELDLGKALALRFADEALPDAAPKVRAIFSGPGAYARFKDLLENRGCLEPWYEFEKKAQQKALRDWCADNEIAVDG